jgi:CRISPR-associated endonuclease Csy4
MDFYIDITIQPDEEMRENVLMNKVFTKFHKALHDLASTDIGASFPATKLLLGRVLRIHATKSRLLELTAINWLGGLSGYCVYGDILSIPAKYENRRVSRWQSNLSESNLRRLIKRGSISQEELKAYKAKMFAAQMTTLPYLELESTSNGKFHRRYVRLSDVYDKPVSGEFDYFGLSKTATVPWF